MGKGGDLWESNICCKTWGLGSWLSWENIHIQKPYVETHTCNPNTGEAETGGFLRLTGQPALQNHRTLVKDPISKNKVEDNLGKHLTLTSDNTGTHSSVLQMGFMLCEYNGH